tara:strand:- start:10035 stop:11573 length:1539 start_codon:yes stop_codon:yes gene_type:complete
MTRRVLFSVAAAIGFSLLAILNVGGYRYGVQDQSFYLPAVLRQLDPTLFLRDTAVLEAQDLFFFFDNAIGWITKFTGWSLPFTFFGLFVLGLLILGIATATLGWQLYGSWYTAATLTLAITLRHRISLTAVNTLEGYLHPRMLAFAVGISALALFMRGRSWPALLITIIAIMLHPTTGLWFLIALSVAVVVAEPPSSRGMLLGILIGTPVLLWLSQAMVGNRFVVMDDAWISVLAHKSYLFPSNWTWTAWLANLGTATVIGAVYLYRYRAGMTSRRETGIICGCAALLTLFILSLPLVNLRLALAVQLQISRIFWILDFIAIASLAWLLTESNIWRRLSWSPTVARHVVVTAVAVTTIIRGGYVSFVEHPNRPVIALRPADSDWIQAMTWVTRTDPETHLLVDPAHAWRHGTSVRVSGQRDVYLEEVKDPAMAIYSRVVARRVLERIQDLGQFDALTVERAHLLADKYDLHYLIDNRPFDLPIVYRAGIFKIYELNQRRPSQVAARTNPLLQ